MKVGCLIIFTFLVFIKSSDQFFWGILGGGITYRLYTRSNPIYGQLLTYGDSNSLTFSSFRNNLPTRILIHGYLQSGYSAMNRDLKNAYFVRGDYNVIVVDWSSVSSFWQAAAAQRVIPTGIALSKFVRWLNVDLNLIHFVGYDLGGHIAGIAGRNLNGLVAKIVGLDPARPGFSEGFTENKLIQSDAEIVEVFHSNGGQLGFFAPYGDLDFYINDGKYQLGCGYIICSHYQAVIVYTRLVSGRNNFAVIPCQDISEVTNGCDNDPINLLPDEVSPAGIYQIKNTNGAINKDIENLS